MIRLVGPGAAGKSIIGWALASHLRWPFLDLDREFMERFGDISRYLDLHDYKMYARNNVDTYLSIAPSPEQDAVIALSSGFMTYSDEVHPSYRALVPEICASPTTFVLLPSLNLEECVRETVRRQTTRFFARSAEREEAVIRERYAKYMAIPATKIETMGPVSEIVNRIMSALPIR